MLPVIPTNSAAIPRMMGLKLIQMKKSIFFLLLLFSSTLIFAQNELLIQSNEKGLYLNHTVIAKENFYSIGRLFNIAAKEIAAFNALDMNHGLMIGQMLKIPLTDANFTQTRSNGRPVYYIVGNGEGLYRVSLKNSKVQMASIRKWNQLSNDQISTSQKLIVGFLISPEANNIHETLPEETPIQTEVSPPTKKDVIIQKKETAPDKIETPPVKEIEKNSSQSDKNSTVNPVKSNSTGGSGYFKNQFDLQIKSQPVKVEQTASTGIFKTTSGWQDAKYYALMDGVEPGTIIRIMNPTNNKVVYAKVLGEMSGIRQNQGYDLRISNAGASALEVSDSDKFIVKVSH